jgi:hypothetical protein
MQLKNKFESHNLKVVDSQTQAAQRSTFEWQFSTVTWMLVSLSVIVAIVGGLALMGAISIGVFSIESRITLSSTLKGIGRTIDVTGTGFGCTTARVNSLATSLNGPLGQPQG